MVRSLYRPQEVDGDSIEDLQSDDEEIKELVHRYLIYNVGFKGPFFEYF